MKWLVIALAFLFAAPAMAQIKAGPSTAMTPTPDERAKQWLVLVDDQNYADAFGQMAASARTKANADQWGQKERGIREPIGAMSSRTLKDVKLTKILPGMRDGQYATVRYDSTFARKALAVESVILVSENGAWSVVSYSIN